MTAWPSDEEWAENERLKRRRDGWQAFATLLVGVSIITLPLALFDLDTGQSWWPVIISRVITVLIGYVLWEWADRRYKVW